MALRDSGQNNTQIADHLKISEASVRRGLRKVSYNPHIVPAAVISKLRVDLERPVRIDVRKWGAGAQTADWHLPLTDFGLVNTFIEQSVDIGARWCGIYGDWFNIDWLSSYEDKQATAGADRELYGSTETMKRLLDVFERVVLSWGNHDVRFQRALGYKLPYSQAMRMLFADLDKDQLDRISFTNLDHVWIDTPRGPYYAAHPQAYSQVPLTNARKLASKHLCNVLTGHSHHTAVGHDVSGRFVCAEIGGFFDSTKTAYLQRSTTFPNWQNGWGFIDEEGWLLLEGAGWSSRVGTRL